MMGTLLLQRLASDFLRKGICKINIPKAIQAHASLVSNFHTSHKQYFSSDFSVNGDIGVTRDWLASKGFAGKFVNWDANALLGSDKVDILAEGGEKGVMLWGLLNSGRQKTEGASVISYRKRIY